MPSPPELIKARLDRDGKLGNSMQGKARTTDEETQRLQALQMIGLRVAGKSYTAIGEEMGGLSPDTVKRRLQWAKAQGLMADAEERIVNELVPAAISAFKKALDAGMYEAARDVLFGTGLLSKNANRAQEQVEMTLEQWREQRKATVVIKTAAPVGTAQDYLQTLSGSVEVPGASLEPSLGSGSGPDQTGAASPAASSEED